MSDELPTKQDKSRDFVVRRKLLYRCHFVILSLRSFKKEKCVLSFQLKVFVIPWPQDTIIGRNVKLGWFLWFYGFSSWIRLHLIWQLELSYINSTVGTEKPDGYGDGGEKKKPRRSGLEGTTLIDLYHSRSILKLHSRQKLQFLLISSRLMLTR